MCVFICTGEEGGADDQAAAEPQPDTAEQDAGGEGPDDAGKEDQGGDDDQGGVEAPGQPDQGADQDQGPEEEQEQPEDGPGGRCTACTCMGMLTCVHKCASTNSLLDTLPACPCCMVMTHEP